MRSCRSKRLTADVNLSFHKSSFVPWELRVFHSLTTCDWTFWVLCLKESASLAERQTTGLPFDTCSVLPTYTESSSDLLTIRLAPWTSPDRDAGGKRERLSLLHSGMLQTPLQLGICVFLNTIAGWKSVPYSLSHHIKERHSHCAGVWEIKLLPELYSASHLGKARADLRWLCSVSLNVGSLTV